MQRKPSFQPTPTRTGTTWTGALLAAALVACSPSEPAESSAEAPVEATQVAETEAAGEEADGRYTSGFQKLDLGIDVASIDTGLEGKTADLTDRSTPESWVKEDDHAGHDHADEGTDVARKTPAGGLQPSGPRFLGGLALIEGQEKEKHFGKVRAGDKRQHLFEFVSNGTEDLVISGVKPSCGCTRAEIEIYDEDGNAKPYDRGDLIPPGQRFRLNAEISTEGKKGTASATVSIFTNSAGGSYNVKLVAEVEPVLDVTPDTAVFFGQMTTADKMEDEVRIASRRKEPFSLTADTRGLKNVSVTLVPEEPDADGRASVWVAKVVAGPGLPVGIRNFPCTLTTDIPIGDAKTEGERVKYHTVPLSVQARVTGLVHAEPAFMGFGLVSPGQVVERALRVECHDDFQLSTDTEIKFEGLYGGEFEHADLMETTITEVEGGKYLDVVVKLLGLPEDVNGSFGGVIKLLVNHPSMEELQVRFSGVCRASVGGQ